VSCISLYSLGARQDLVSVVDSKAYGTERLTFSAKLFMQDSRNTERCIFTFLPVMKTGTADWPVLYSDPDGSRVLPNLSESDIKEEKVLFIHILVYAF
jgi:hypothetical protein